LSECPFNTWSNVPLTIDRMTDLTIDLSSFDVNRTSRNCANFGAIQNQWGKQFSVQSPIELNWSTDFIRRKCFLAFICYFGGTHFCIKIFCCCCCCSQNKKSNLKQSKFMCGCVLVLLVQQKIENKSVVVWKKSESR